MPDISYHEPVAQLLTLGDPRDMPAEEDIFGAYHWCNYPTRFGLTTEHVPELIRMATDEDLNMAMSDSKEVWAPLHAWRALGLLKAEEAVAPLLTLLHRIDDNNDDWAGEDLPDALARIGPAAVPLMADYLADPKNKLWARVGAASSLSKLGKYYPEAREACIRALSATLENYRNNDETLNGFIISRLTDLQAVEAAPLVEQAFKSGLVDESVMGDWTDFQVEVGLLDESALENIIEHDEGPAFNPFFRSTSDPIHKPPKTQEQKKKEKNKEKEAKASRKRHRKKK